MSFIIYTKRISRHLEEKHIGRLRERVIRL